MSIDNIFAYVYLSILHIILYLNRIYVSCCISLSDPVLEIVLSFSTCIKIKFLVLHKISVFAQPILYDAHLVNVTN